ncbi:DNA-binding pseudobarrel domain-containing protein [Tanacetum coccineum]
MGHHRPPSFYHILMNPSSPHLPLPLKFVKKHLRNKILKKPILKSANGGYLWKLKMKKFDDHTFCFVDGWCKVVKDVGLLFGEFLLFKYVGSSVFLMHVYSVNGCEKILVPRINNFKVVDDEVSVVEEDDDVEYDVEEDDEDVAEEDEEEDDDDDDGDDEDDVDVDGWKEFQRSNDISEGDKCVLKFITSEDKLCLAKVTKKKTRTTEVDNDDMDDDDGMDEEGEAEDAKEDDSNVDGDDIFDDEGKGENAKLVNVDDDRDVDDGMDGKDVVVDDNRDGGENVEPVDDGMDGKDVVVDDNKDEDENVEPVDDGMDGKDVVVDDNKDEDENVEPVDDGMDGKDVVVDDNKDEDENVEPVDDGMDGKDVVVADNKDEDENVELVDDGMDVDADDNKDEDKDAEFVVTITPINKSKLVLPKDFVVLAGIESKENIIMKSLDGNETKMSIRTDKRHRATYYHLSVGWPAFKRSNNISEGDKCVFKYITSKDRLCLAKFTKAPPTEVEDKMCLVKVTKEKTRTRLPSPAEVVKRKRGRLPPATKIKMTAAENVKMRSRRPPPVEITVGEAVKRKRGWTPTSSPRVAKDVKRKKGPRLRVHSADVEGVDEGVAVGKKRRGRPVK